MAATFRLEITTPERPLLDKQVTEAQIPASTGIVGILPDHAPMLAELGYGELSYKMEGREESLLIHGGFLEVLPNHARVLATVAEQITDIDVTRAQEALARAQKRLTINVPDVDKARALAAMQRAEARLAAAKAGHH